MSDAGRRPDRASPLFPRGGGEGALLGVMAIMSFLACVVAGPLCDPSAIARVALPAVGLAAALGLFAQLSARKV